MIELTQDILWARRLKIRHLETFLVLTEAPTLTAAAALMNMSQSAMSHWLKDIEDLIGAPLFVRGRTLELTLAGEVMRRHASRILGDVRRTHIDLGAIMAGSVGNLRVGTVHSGLAALLPAAIVAFQRDRPGVAIRVSEAPFRQLLDALHERDLDLIIVPIDSRAYGAGLAHETLLEDSMEVVVGPGHPLAGDAPLSWDDIIAFPWIVPPAGTLMRQRLDTARLAAGSGQAFAPRIESGSIQTVQSVLRRTDYVSVLAGLVARPLHELGLLRILPMARPEVFGQIGVIWHEADTYPLVEQFREVLRREAFRLTTATATAKGG